MTQDKPSNHNCFDCMIVKIWGIKSKTMNWRLMVCQKKNQTNNNNNIRKSRSILSLRPLSKHENILDSGKLKTKFPADAIQRIYTRNQWKRNTFIFDIFPIWTCQSKFCFHQTTVLYIFYQKIILCIDWLSYWLIVKMLCLKALVKKQVIWLLVMFRMSDLYFCIVLSWLTD